MTGSCIIPTIRYRDSTKMVEWLGKAFGFEEHLVVPGEGGAGVVHAEMTLGNAVIMFGAVREGDDPFGAFQKPIEKGAPATQSPYMIVEDVDGLCERARAAGADIVYGPVDEDDGGRGFSCRDPEGQLWNFGSYDPWA